MSTPQAHRTIDTAQAHINAEPGQIKLFFVTWLYLYLRRHTANVTTKVAGESYLCCSLRAASRSQEFGNGICLSRSNLE